MKHTLHTIIVESFYLMWIIFYTKLLLFDHIRYYLAPRMNIFSWIMYLCIWTMFLFYNYGLLSRQYARLKKSHLLYLFPLLLLICTPPTSLGERSLTKKRSTIYKKSTYNNSQDRRNSTDNTVSKKKNSTLSITSAESFARYLDEIYSHTQTYFNRTCTIKGIFFIDKKVCMGNQAIIGRYAMICCAADAIFTGFIVEFSSRPAYKNGDWFQITGILEKRQTKPGIAPVFRVLNAKTVIKDPLPYFIPQYR